MNSETIKLISINIETEKHLDLVRAFLKKEQPDVVCMQEVYEQDLKEFGETLNMHTLFGQMNLMGYGNKTKAPFIPYGIGMLSALPMEHTNRSYYTGNEQKAKNHVFNGNSEDDYHLFLSANIQKENTNFTIATTHFIWTPDGKPNDLQRRDLKSLLAILKEFPDIVLCGDFNAPRGTEIFNALAAQYKDNIPKNYTTSIDIRLHRVGNKLRNESLMVDGLFTSPHYTAKNVHLQDGVSDHMAIIAEISKAKM